MSRVSSWPSKFFWRISIMPSMEILFSSYTNCFIAISESAAIAVPMALPPVKLYRAPPSFTSKPFSMQSPITAD